MVVTTWEKWLARKHLGEDTAYGPYIDGLDDDRMVRTKNMVLWRTRGPTFVYCLNVSMISGARYQRVATYSVMNPVSVPEGSAVLTDRAKPKSQTLRSQFALSSRLDGLRSR